MSSRSFLFGPTSRFTAPTSELKGEVDLSGPNAALPIIQWGMHAQIPLGPRISDAAAPHLLEQRARLTPRIAPQSAACLALLSSRDLDGALTLALRYFPSIEASGACTIRQVRVGVGGELQQFVKIRTMRADVRSSAAEIAAHAAAREKTSHADARVTPLGRVLRTFWVDEWPQFLDLLKGKLRIFGIRPCLPVEFLCMPPEMQRLRSKFKPGLINALLGAEVSGACGRAQAEMQYLLAKEKHPWRTDIVYFSRAVYNVLIKGRRG